MDTVFDQARGGKVLIDPMVMNVDDTSSTITKILLKMEFRMLREMHHMTQQDLAKASGLSIQCISDIENPSSGNPTLKSITRYLDAFGYELHPQRKVVK